MKYYHWQIEPSLLTRARPRLTPQRAPPLEAGWFPVLLVPLSTVRLCARTAACQFNRAVCLPYAFRAFTAIRLHPTRLETWSKYSNMCASLPVIEIRRRNEIKGSLGCRGEKHPCGAGLSIDLFYSWKGLSKSVPVGTQKIVNYA